MQKHAKHTDYIECVVQYLAQSDMFCVHVLPTMCSHPAAVDEVVDDVVLDDPPMRTPMILTLR